MENKSVSPVPGKKSKVEQITFPAAIVAITAGFKVRRLEWSNKDEYCLLRESFLMIHRNDKFHAWTVSEGDMLAVDWVIIK